MTPPRACMGGWCPHRTACENYLTPDRREPSENLCNEIDRLNEAKREEETNEL